MIRKLCGVCLLSPHSSAWSDSRLENGSLCAQREPWYLLLEGAKYNILSKKLCSYVLNYLGVTWRTDVNCLLLFHLSWSFLRVKSGHTKGIPWSHFKANEKLAAAWGKRLKLKQNKTNNSKEQLDLQHPGKKSWGERFFFLIFLFLKIYGIE